MCASKKEVLNCTCVRFCPPVVLSDTMEKPKPPTRTAEPFTLVMFTSMRKPASPGMAAKARVTFSPRLYRVSICPPAFKGAVMSATSKKGAANGCGTAGTFAPPCAELYVAHELVFVSLAGCTRMVTSPSW